MAHSQMVEAGVRVIRGPHWQSGEIDGGEGHLGILHKVLDDGHVRVLWDNGQEVTCKAGADGIHELRILDTAPVGIRHLGTQCSECSEQDVYGMIWRCLGTSCKDVVLCSLCYSMDKHDITHVFQRLDMEGSRGERMKKRSVSLKIRSIGIFVGARVERGHDWIWADQDGGPGCTGEVLGFENVAPSSSRNMVRVTWDSGLTNSYRLGLQGNMDLKCVEEATGIYYYREHLPVLDATGQKGTSDGTSSLTATSSASASSTPSSSSLQSSSTLSLLMEPLSLSAGGAEAGAGAEFKVGDKVAIVVNDDKLRELQAKFGGATAGMINCLGKTGHVTCIVSNGSVQVKFKHLAYRFNPQVLVKVPDLSVGDTVRIGEDIEQTKSLNRRVGWKSDMDAACGKVGKVIKIDDDGDVAVAFGRQVHLFAPVCCERVTGVSTDNLQNSSSSGSTSESGEDSEGKHQTEFHQRVLKTLARLVLDDARGGGGAKEGRQTRSEEGNVKDQLFMAIHNGDVDAVRNVCMAQSLAIDTSYKGLTLLMVACHEGQREIVELLLDLGAGVNTQGLDGHTPLGTALEGKKESIALLLLDRGADVSLMNGKKRNAVHIAAYNNMDQALREIIKRGGAVNHKDKYGDSPFHDAVSKENNEAIDVLIEVPYLYLRLTDRKGLNALHLACLKGNVYAVEKILKRDKSGVDELSNSQFTAMQIAVTNDNVECARLLIAEGKANVDFRGSQGLTALHLACNEAYPRSVELLLSYGADVQIGAERGYTPLHLAIATRSVQLKKNPSAQLEAFEHRNRIRIAIMLLEKGAFIDARSDDGITPLQCGPDDITDAVKRFCIKNPQLIKRQAGEDTDERSSSSADDEDLRATLQLLLQDRSEVRKQQLQEHCKQS